MKRSPSSCFKIVLFFAVVPVIFFVFVLCKVLRENGERRKECPYVDILKNGLQRNVI